MKAKNRKVESCPVITRKGGIRGKKWEASRPVIRRKCPTKEEWREHRRKGGILGIDNKEGKRGISGIERKIAW